MKKKIMMSVMAFAGMLLCVGCSSDDDEKEKELPIWNSEGWQSAKYTMVESRGRQYIEVPPEGGTYTFTRSDAKRIAISYLDFEPYDEHANNIYGSEILEDKYKYNYLNGWCEVTVKDNTVQFHFKANTLPTQYEYYSTLSLLFPDTRYERKTFASIMVGDDFESFCFLQKPVCQSRAGNPLVGNWINETPSDDRGYWKSAFGSERIYLHDNGTYDYIFESHVRPTTGISSDIEYGIWKDSADYIVFHPIGNDRISYSLMSLYDWKMQYKLVDGKLYDVGRGNQFYGRIENSTEPFEPRYQYEIVPTKSASKWCIKSGEPYTLNIIPSFKGRNYKLEEIYLVNYKLEKNDTIDISRYRRNDDSYSIPMIAPNVNGFVTFGLLYRGTFTSSSVLTYIDKNFYKEMYIDFRVVD